MIWIIASVPLWLLASLVFFLGAACIGMSFDGEYCRRERIEHTRDRYIIFGLLMLAISGCVALAAAKICS